MDKNSTGRRKLLLLAMAVFAVVIIGSALLINMDRETHKEAIRQVIPDISEKDLEDLSARPVYAAYGRVRNNQDLDAIINSADADLEERHFFYPEGPVFGYSVNHLDCIMVYLDEEAAVNRTTTDEIYGVIESHARAGGTNNTPVLFVRTLQITPDTTLQRPERASAQPTPREGTSYLDIHGAGGRSVLLYPEDEEYPAIETECRELIGGIRSQLKMSYTRDELAAMKRNGTYVALHFSRPTTFETSYIVDRAPLNITINEAVFFLDRDEERNMVITPAQNGAGVWTTSRDRATLRKLAVPVLIEEGRGSTSFGKNLTYTSINLPPAPEKVVLYTVVTPAITAENVSTMAERMGLKGTVREADGQFTLSDSPYSLEVHRQSGRVALIDIPRWMMPNARDLPANLPPDERATEIAAQYLTDAGLMPRDAVLCGVEHPEIVESNERGETTGIAYEAVQVSYCRKIDGRPVVGSEMTVDVGGGGDILNVYKIWRDFAAGEEIAIITPREALEELKILGVPADPMRRQTVEITGIELGYYEAGATEDPAHLVPVYIFTGTVTDGSTETSFVRYVAASPKFRGEIPWVKS
ncbi:MAG: hypothetical protein PHP59_06780 [Methanofollis sp.]|uniref:hypothetical protein n=1 Tax=Methanofollis sp. TaxID=2052835 RepID=UPI0026018AE7|nr:hypothetical protein [Methanofollis sp.]MDD4255067.1 hypothetical protein [Methanofollis sp.]